MDRTQIFLISVATICIAVAVVSSSEVETEKRLLRSLLKDYSKDIRPAARNEPVKLSLKLQLINLQDLNLEKQSLGLHAWIQMIWKDTSLRWNTSDYDGIDSLMIANKDVWLPDIKLYNSIEPEHGVMDTKVVVSNDGSILYLPRVSLHSHCEIARDENGFVEEDQHCHLKFGSWVYNGNLVTLSHYEDLPHVDMQGYNPHPQWTLLEAKGTKHTLRYECCPEPYEDITYDFYMRRNKVDSTKLAPSDVIPMNAAITITCLVSLVPTIFLLPPESREKITLGVGVLILLGVLRTMSHSQSLATLVDVNLLLVSISITCSALVLNMWYNSSLSSVVAERLRQLVFGLAAFCCLGGKLPSKHRKQAEEATLSGIENNNKTPAKPSGEWQVMAKVIDRVLCVAFFITTIVCCIGALG